jgi:hypothetical protein
VPKLCVGVAPVGNLLDGYMQRFSFSPCFLSIILTVRNDNHFRLSDSGTAIQDYLRCEPVYENGDTSLAKDSPYR